MTVGERIRILRKEAGLTQKQLGEKLGVSASMIGQYETNSRKPKLETLKKIASVLNVNISEIVDLGSISPSLNSMLPLIETFKNIQNKTKDESGSIPLSPDERNQIRELYAFVEKIPGEMENSPFFHQILEDAYFSLYNELNFYGKCTAIQMLRGLIKNPDYKAK